MGNSFKGVGGLSWYPRVTNFKISNKVKRLRAEFGGKFMERRFPEDLYASLIEYIYMNKGYFYEWNEDEELTWTEEYGCEVADVKRALNILLKHDFFNKELYEKYGILTSRRMQIVCINANVEKTKIQINADYMLIDDKDLRDFTLKALRKLVFFSINHGDNPINHGENEKNPAVILQIRKEKIIEEKIRLNKTVVVTTDKSREESPDGSDNSVETVDNSVDDSVENDILAEIKYNGGKNSLIFTTNYVNTLKVLYPDVDFETETYKIQKWINKRPVFKFKKTIAEFIDDWYNRVQKSGGSTAIDEEANNT